MRSILQKISYWPALYNLELRLLLIVHIHIPLQVYTIYLSPYQCKQAPLRSCWHMQHLSQNS